LSLGIERLEMRYWRWRDKKCQSTQRLNSARNGAFRQRCGFAVSQPFG
jgi:hypothetical protein